MSLDIRQATQDDIPALYVLYDKIGKKDDGYFETVLDKDCLILIASEENQDIGFVILNFEPKYNLYKKMEIPEIQDLNVIPDARQKGAATALVMACENIAEDQGATHVGISVGLTKDYGPAQRLYVKLDYMPDGNGITSQREPVQKHELYAADDDLCLMMVKEL